MKLYLNDKIAKELGLPDILESDYVGEQGGIINIQENGYVTVSLPNKDVMYIFPLHMIRAIVEDHLGNLVESFKAENGTALSPQSQSQPQQRASVKPVKTQVEYEPKTITK